MKLKLMLVYQCIHCYEYYQTIIYQHFSNDMAPLKVLASIDINNLHIDIRTGNGIGNEWLHMKHSVSTGSRHVVYRCKQVMTRAWLEQSCFLVQIMTLWQMVCSNINY